MKEYEILKEGRALPRKIYADFIEHVNGAVLFYRYIYNTDNEIPDGIELHALLDPGTWVYVKEVEEDKE